MFVHGGTWDSGDKNYRAGGADVYANIGRFDAARGLGVAVDNYRLQPAVVWPLQADDVRAAMAWVRGNIEPRESRRSGDSRVRTPIRPLAPRRPGDRRR